MFDNGVILAAGRGMRMRPLTDSTPKPLLPNIEKCLLRQQVSFMRDHVKHLYVTVGYMGEVVGEAAKRFGVDIVVDIGSGGNASWIHSSELGLIDSPLLVVTCDNVMDVDLGRFQKEADSSPGDSFIVAVEKDANYPGDRIITNGRKISALGPSNSSSLLASGLQAIIPRKITERCGSVDGFSEVWADLILHQELSLSEVRPSAWVAIDTSEQMVAWGNSNFNK